MSVAATSKSDGSLHYSISLIEFNDINYFALDSAAAAAAAVLCVGEKLMEARDVFAHNGEIFCEMRMIFHFHDDAIILDGHRVAEPSNMNYKFCVREKHTRVVCREREEKLLSKS